MTVDSTVPPRATARTSAGRSSGTAPSDHGRPSLLRLTVVELRKLTDTRSGFWLLVVIALLSAGIVTVFVLSVPDGDQRFDNLFAAAQIPVGLLLPVLGILLVTSEFSQRTLSTTFALVPRRHRVVLAKLAAGVLAALAAVVVCLATTTVGTLLATGDGATPGAWSTSAAAILGSAVFLVVNMLMGIAFGLMLHSTPLAIVLSLVLPVAWSVLGELVTRLRSAAEWLDIGTTTAVLVEPPAAGDLTAGQWARLAVSVAVWVGVPLVAGLVRTARREVS